MFNSYWQRKANFHSVKWGTLNCSEDEAPRPEFKGILRPSRTSAGMELYFSPKERMYRQLISYCTTFFMVGLVIVLVTAIFVYKAILIQSGNHQLGATLCAVVNNVQIIVMNIVYDKLALKLNDWENHQTQSDYENALIVKKVGYQFVNYYISLFYIAFMKEHFEGCVNGDCMGELRSSLWVFYIINVVFNFIELGTPILSQKRAIQAEEDKAKKMKAEGKISRVEMTYTESQGKLESIELMNEYLEVVMNHGYIIFFCVAFPLGPLIYWLYNVLELKADAYKFLKLSKRPFPEMASGIGVWSDIMNVLAVIGVVTNTGLMVFTENIFNLDLSARWSVFIVMEHLIIVVVALYIKFSPQFGESKRYAAVSTSLKRHQYLLKLKYYKSVKEDGVVQFSAMPPLVEDVVHSDEK